MYSSTDNPTTKEWVAESERLLAELKTNLRVYRYHLLMAKEKNNTSLMKHYCLKLLKANRELELSRAEWIKKIEGGQE